MDDIEAVFERLERISSGERRRRRTPRSSRSTTATDRRPSTD